MEWLVQDTVLDNITVWSPFGVTHPRDMTISLADNTYITHCWGVEPLYNRSWANLVGAAILHPKTTQGIVHTCVFNSILVWHPPLRGFLTGSQLPWTHCTPAICSICVISQWNLHVSRVCHIKGCTNHYIIYRLSTIKWASVFFLITLLLKH